MAITVKDVTKHFGEFRALDSVSVDVPSGSLTALLGPSSAVSDPAGTATDTSSSATNDPNVLLTERASITGSPSA